MSADLATAIPDAEQRDAVSEQIIDNADPRAYAAEIGPGRPIETASGATRAQIEDADDDFKQGIQLALGVAAFLTGGILVLGWFLYARDDPRKTTTAVE